MQKTIMVMMTFIILSFVPLTSYAQTDKPMLYAVSFHADWCGSCKALGPKVIKARGKADLDNQNVLFVKLDLTNKTTRHQSSLMASALGLGDYYKNNNGKTGFILLVNSSNGEVLGKLTKDMDAGQISAMINEKIAQL